MCATKDIGEGDAVFRDESSIFTLVTKSHVEKYWSESEKRSFAQYAWPISKEVIIVSNRRVPFINSLSCPGVRNMEPRFSKLEADQPFVLTKVR